MILIPKITSSTRDKKMHTKRHNILYLYYSTSQKTISLPSFIPRVSNSSPCDVSPPSPLEYNPIVATLFSTYIRLTYSVWPRMRMSAPIRLQTRVNVMYVLGACCGWIGELYLWVEMLGLLYFALFRCDFRGCGKGFCVSYKVEN
jgi:hypothetical protein